MDPALLLVRARQLLHSAAPLIDEYEPRLHGTHAVAPSASWKLPAAHLLHEDCCAAAVNVPELQLDATVAPSTHADPAGHSWHCACRATDWNRPAVQRLHTVLSAAATLPASHAVGTAEPVAHADPSGQLAQSAALVRSVALPYVPAAQSKAAEAPSAQYAP